ARAGSRRIAREMTAPNHDLVRELAIRDREAGGGRTRKEGRDSRHDLEVDSRSRERDELLPESSEKPRVASLQADDSKPLLRRSDQELADVRPVRAAEILADVDELDATRDSLEDRGPDEPVVIDDVGPLEPIERAKREEPGNAGARADDRDAGGRGLARVEI